MIDPHESNGSPFTIDRRHYGRQKVLFSSVVIRGNNRGRVRNISPNGLALQTDEEWIGDTLPKIRFHFSQSQPWVEARGRIAWRSKSRKVMGVEFIGLTDDVRKQIQTWITSRSDWSESPNARMSFEQAENGKGAEAGSETTTVIPAPAPKAVDQIAENRSGSSIISLVRSHLETKDAPISAKRVGDENIADGISKAPRFAWLVLTAALLLSAFSIRGHYLQKLWNGQKSGEVTRAPNLPRLSSKISATATSNPGLAPDHPAPTSNPGLSLDHPAFVLQVGAMAHEENANALAGVLTQLNFPAFVFQSRDDRLHHVFVGPFTSSDATLAAKKDLERRGYRAFRLEWKPTSP